MKIQVLSLLALAVTVMEARVYNKPCDGGNNCNVGEEPIFDLRQIYDCSCAIIDKNARSEPADLAGLTIIQSCSPTGTCPTDLDVRRDIDGKGRVDCVCV